jgi:hypothetical protein
MDLEGGVADSGSPMPYKSGARLHVRSLQLCLETPHVVLHYNGRLLCLQAATLSLLLVVVGVFGLCGDNDRPVLVEGVVHRMLDGLVHAVRKRGDEDQTRHSWAPLGEAARALGDRVCLMQGRDTDSASHTM